MLPLRPRLRCLQLSAIVATVLASAVGSGASAVAPVLERPALMTPLASHAVLLGIARAGQRLVAVGERGIVVVSDDRGETWRQAAVPVSVTLTAVTFPEPLQGWAVGHSGVILHSSDGGLTWSRQLDGVTAARLALEDARSQLRAKPGDARKANDVRQGAQLVTDGPDKPFLQVHFFDARRGIVVGAYGLIFATTDGGQKWLPWMSRVDNPDRFHIYAIAVAGKHLYLAGEQGLLERSNDDGTTFARLRSPYRGSYFALAAIGSDGLFIAGLRGNAYRSHDEGASFTRVASPVPVSFDSVATRRDGSLVLTEQAGAILTWHDADPALRVTATPGLVLPPLAGITEASDGALVVVGMGGVLRVPLGKSGS